MALQRILHASETNAKTSVSELYVPDPSRIIIGTHDNNKNCLIWYFNLEVSPEPVALAGHNNFIASLAVEGDTLLSGAHDKIVLWDLKTLQPCQIFHYSPATAYVVLFWDSNTIVSCHHDKLIRVWDRQTSLCRLELAGHTYKNGVRNMERYKDRLISAAEDIRVWDVETGSCSLVMQTDGSTWISSLAIGDGIVAASYGDRKARVWDLESGQLLATLEGHTLPLAHIQIDGGTIATASADRCICIWSENSFELIHRSEGPTGEELSCRNGRCVTGVIGFAFKDGVLIGTGWEGVAKYALVKNLSALKPLGPTDRTISKAQICDRKIYLAAAADGRVSIEIWDPAASADGNSMT